MKLRNFVYLLGIVALVAVLYSPSVIRIGTGGAGTTAPTNSGEEGASAFLAYLRTSGFHVVTVNDSQTELSMIASGKSVLLLIGADIPVSALELQAIKSRYDAGTLSLLVAEGNTTNEALINSVLNVNVSGAAIVDPNSAYQNKEVLSVVLKLGSPTPGLLDVASPILISSNSMEAVATTSNASTDTQDSAPGPRTVVSVGTSSGGARSLLVTDSAPFLNYLFSNRSLPVDESAFVGSMVNWATRSNRTNTVLYDNFHYAPPTPKAGFGLPVGPVFAWVLELVLKSVNSFVPSTSPGAPNVAAGFGYSFGGPLVTTLLALLMLMWTFGTVRKWFAPEKAGKDDQPPPKIERTIVAESKARLDFLSTSRKKSFYIATLARLYEVVDEVIAKELGVGMAAVTREQLTERLGEERAEAALQLFADLKRVYGYAKGERRFMFPPVLRWRSRASNLTRRSELFLNEIGMTMGGEHESKKRVEYQIAAH